MADQWRIGTALNEFLKLHAESCLLHRKRVRAHIQAVVNPILADVREADPTLDFEPLDMSSFFLAIRSRHVYEVNVNLRSLETEDFSIEDGQTAPGFALVKINSKTRRSKWEMYSGRSNPGKMYLSAKLISEKLLERIKASLKRKPQHSEKRISVQVSEELFHNTVTLELSGMDPESYFVSLVPAISCAGRWTYSANAWLNEHSHWPNKILKQETISDGIHLVGKPSPTKSAYQWCITFPKPTKRLIQADIGCRNKCLSVMEIILENTPYAPRGVDQSHFKALVLHMSKKFPVQEFWAEDKFSQRFRDLMLELQRCLAEKNLAEFFLPGMNLFRDLEEPTFKIWKLQLKEILQDVERFLQHFENAPYTTAL